MRFGGGVTQAAETTPKQGELIAAAAGSPSLESLNYRELKCLARLLAIPKYSNLRQTAMLDAVRERSGDIYPGMIQQAIAIAETWKTEKTK